MTRPFNPPNVGFAPDLHARLIERRLIASGEYVRHLPTNQPEQWVVMNYQFIPVDAAINPDYVVSGTNPKLWGLVEHFECVPELFQGGSENRSVRNRKGSQFEIRGLIYNVKKVDANHRGSICVELVQDDKCAEPRADFCTDVELVSACQ